MRPRNFPDLKAEKPMSFTLTHMPGVSRNDARTIEEPTLRINAVFSGIFLSSFNERNLVWESYWQVWLSSHG